MYELADYKRLLGQEIIKFLDEKISFDELKENISSDDLSNIRENETIKLVWHALYQLEMDSNLEDRDFVDALKNRMRDIALASSSDDIKIKEYNEKYFNVPAYR